MVSDKGEKEIQPLIYTHPVTGLPVCVQIYKYRLCSGFFNGTIGNFTNGTIGSQWYHWLTICTIGRANGTIGITIGTNGIANGITNDTIGRTLSDFCIPLVPLVEP